MSAITAADIEHARFVYFRHLNCMYVDQPDRKIYGHEYCCVPYPRLTQIYWHQRVDNERWKRSAVFCVDFKEVADLDAAVDALNVPPLLTSEEAAVLDLIPTEAAGYFALIDLFADVSHRYRDLSWRGRRDRFKAVIRQLQDKGLVEFQTPSGPESEDHWRRETVETMIQRRADCGYRIGDDASAPT